MKFAAIDFETANTSDESICAAGLVLFEDGKLVESRYWLIRPPKGFGWFREDWTAGCHGLSHLDVHSAPEFPAIAREFFTRLSGAGIVVAHHAQFDMRKLCATAAHFGLEIPAFEYLCTYRLAEGLWPELPNHRLSTVAAHIGHEFQHHHAAADAEAAGRILLAMISARQAAGPRALAEALGMQPTSIHGGEQPANAAN